MSSSVVSMVLGAVAVGALFIATPRKLGELPGYDDVKPINFDHYAGRIQLQNDQKMFYWLVEAEEKAAQAPLILWLNGGPGYLSVKKNPYSWNRHANMLYHESPFEVRFSTTVLNATEYNDSTTTARAVEFLRNFLKLYPKYNNQPFYITGECYAGMYIPWLVDSLIKTPIPGINLAGMAIGNAYTDQDIDNESYIDYYYTHGFISMKAYTAIKS
ncbi:serine protease family S10 [Thraustotheca clavata]|uniref:Serine protease family S10 n=1 Tax=Thraustotheca clavata TaxID=74557 RepID=A0A1V9ZRD6_9STRA|nr:serine protease family S10 [Thraustotheca clavata]